ncbi:MAG: hypothetical protein KA004_01420 [Verrucomicrobiales bacterium]|nr:hypothetical protein [Verrucomicrobiales bacterium]
MVPTTAAPDAPQRDFPEWMDPMVVKELRQALQHRFFLVPFITVHFILLGTLAVEWMALQQSQATSQGVRPLIHPTLGKLAFWEAAYLVVAYLMPLRGFDALQEERQRGNTELLLMAGLTRWKIVRGKWMVQMFLTLLVVSSLLPYAIVRYFFGGIEITESAIQLLAVIGASLANSGLIIGTSGYSRYSVRLPILFIGLIYVLSVVVAVNTIVLEGPALFGISKLSPIVFFYILVCLLAIFALYAVLGLQLGRAHLKLCLVPWEQAPTRSIAGLLLISPFILLTGILITCGWGGLFIILIFIITIIQIDRAPTAPASVAKPAAMPLGF